MNVDRINPSGGVYGVYKKNQARANRIGGANPVSGEELELSESGKIFHAALKAAKEAPDVDEAKVKELSQKIKSGSYNVDSRDIAGKMVKGSFFDRTV